jgi:serine/threonine-protein kinase HipA
VSLAVWLHDTRVGTLRTGADGDPVFHYDDAALGTAALAVSPSLPVRAGDQPPAATLAFFENLLPEGELRRALELQARRRPGVTGLLGVVGGDCAGAVSVWPDDDPLGPTRPARYVDVSPERLATAFADAPLDGDGDLRQRASLSGTVPKCVVHREPPWGGVQPTYRLPLDGAPSTGILKRPRETFPGLLHAELLGMALMGAADVPVADHAPCAVAPSLYETRRFDRVVAPDGTVTKRRAEDGCQLIGVTSSRKYGGTERGATFARLVAGVRRISADGPADVALLWRWAVACVLMGNEDAHAKNVTMLEGDGGWRLAPAYDVVVTLAWPLDRLLAIPFGGARGPREITRFTLDAAAREFGFRGAVAARRAREAAVDVADRIDASIDDALHAVARQAGDHDTLDRLAVLLPAHAHAVRRALFGVG